MILNETYTLSNSVKIPKLGLGTWMLTDSEAAQAVRDAVAMGYRHIDTAQAYGNEAGVGEGIRICGISRDELFVTSKVAAENKSYDSAAQSIDETLRKTELDYIDMMIIHSPQRALEDAYKAGKVRAIGVSNFLEDDLENILNSCGIKPMVNQILTHISNTPFSLIDFCNKNGIQTEAYSPIAHGEALKNKAIADIAAKYSVTPAQLCVRYVLDLGMVALPKTANPEHIKANADVDFNISSEDLNTLKNFEKIKDYGEYSFFPVFSGK